VFLSKMSYLVEVFSSMLFFDEMVIFVETSHVDNGFVQGMMNWSYRHWVVENDVIASFDILLWLRVRSSLS